MTELSQQRQQYWDSSRQVRCLVAVVMCVFGCTQNVKPITPILPRAIADGYIVLDGRQVELPANELSDAIELYNALYSEVSGGSQIEFDMGLEPSKVLVLNQADSRKRFALEYYPGEKIAYFSGRGAFALNDTQVERLSRVFRNKERLRDIARD